METLRVSTKQLTYRDCEPFFEGPVRVTLTKEASTNIERSHNRLLSILEKKESKKERGNKLGLPPPK